MSEDIACPFCEKKGFDLIGLKYHFEMGYCQPYNNTMTVEEESKLRQVKKFLDGNQE